MTSKEFELIKEMLQMQAKLDEAIMNEYGLNEIDEENLRMAILDEVGELTHELKGSWCWWKKTQAPVDDKKVLGELVDIWHFVLSYQNHFNSGEEMLCNYLKEKEMSDIYLERLRDKTLHFTFALSHLFYYKYSVITILVAITEYLGFTIEQVYEAYCDKNKVNYQRLKEGY
ncbi:MAG: dUTP diphosphatase [Holdemanella sp.]|uniref:dUTP diphosphatase n=1 Tax=Holdemanella sp. TaxID=1971762 RepID=UPI002590301D|nr:dUTP diphosphatase [Holdemanella sp.]MCI7166945.1 dUTP diphosphatase [Holdemanella sp.]